MDSKINAQQRVDQIQAFRAELRQLQDEDVLQLTEPQQTGLQSYHNQLLDKLNNSFDVDVTVTDKQLSLGLKLASLFGALGFAAGIFFLFYQYWGWFTPLVQSAVLLVSPLISLAICWICLKKDRSGYYAKIAGFLTLTCFILNLSMLGQIYNIPETPNAFFVWCLLALGLAYATKSRLLLGIAILLFSSFVSAHMADWIGFYWFAFFERPENLLLPALLIFATGHVIQHNYENFAPVYRVAGAILFLFPVLVLSNWGESSYFHFNAQTVELLYLIIGFAGAVALIAWGIRQRWHDAINTGTAMFTLFLFVRFFAWFWDWFPKYLFFMLVGVTSLLILAIFKRLRLQNKSALNTPRQKTPGALHDEP